MAWRLYASRSLKTLNSANRAALVAAISRSSQSRRLFWRSMRKATLAPAAVPIAAASTGTITSFQSSTRRTPSADFRSQILHASAPPFLDRGLAFDGSIRRCFRAVSLVLEAHMESIRLPIHIWLARLVHARTYRARNQHSSYEW